MFDDGNHDCDKFDRLLGYFAGITTNDFVFGHVDVFDMINYAAPTDKALMEVYVNTRLAPYVQKLKESNNDDVNYSLRIVNNRVLWGRVENVKDCIRKWRNYIGNGIETHYYHHQHLMLSFETDSSFTNKFPYRIVVDDQNIEDVRDLAYEMKGYVTSLVVDLAGHLLTGQKVTAFGMKMPTNLDSCINELANMSHVKYVNVRGTPFSTKLRRDYFSRIDRALLKKLVWIENDHMSTLPWYNYMIVSCRPDEHYYTMPTKDEIEETHIKYDNIVSTVFS